MIFRLGPLILRQSFQLRKEFERKGQRPDWKRRRQPSARERDSEKGKTRRDAIKAAREADQEDTRKTAKEGKTRRDAAKAAREGRTRRDAAKRAREKFQPTLPSCSSLQMSHVTGVFASGARGWFGGRGAVQASFFHTVNFGHDLST